MKTIPIARPGAGPAPTGNPDAQAAAQRREAAIAKLSPPSQPAPQHVQNPIPTNPNQVSVEELQSVSQTLQSDSSVEPTESKVTTEQVREVSKPQEDVSQSQLAVLARKERAQRVKAQQEAQKFQSDRQAWEVEKQQLSQRLQELEQGYIPKSQLKQATFEALQSGELTYDEITQEVMNPIDRRSQLAISRLEQRIAEQDKKLAAYDSKVQESQTQQYQAAVKQIETDVRNLVRVDPSYEMIQVTGSHRDVVELIEKTYQEDGYVMTVEEASQQVEDYLVEEASKLAKIQKIQKRVSPPAPAVKKADEPAKQTPSNQQTQPMKTLTNANSGSRKLTSRERAILAMRGELKS